MCYDMIPLKFSSEYHLQILLNMIVLYPSHLVRGSTLRAFNIITKLVAPQVNGLYYVKNYSAKGKYTYIVPNSRASLKYVYPKVYRI